MGVKRIGVVPAAFLVLSGWLAGCGQAEVSLATRVSIETTPVDGADVTIDGVPEGQTPLTLTNLPPKEYVVYITKDGYKPSSRTMTVTAQGEQRLVVNLEPRVGFLSVESDPPGAEVVLDTGEVCGKTPLKSYPVPMGDRTYELRLTNYQPVTNTFYVEEDYVYPFLHQLRPVPASVEIFSRPSGALIWINDQKQAEVTPATFELIPDTYTVSVYQPGYLMAEEVLTLKPGDSRIVSLTLEPGDAPLNMVLIPGGEFIMGFDGIPDESPQRKVTLKPFYIDRHEVTNAEYKAVIPTHVYEKGRDNYPVTNVSWEEARFFAEAVGKRLPTEEEWERAARGTDGRQYPWGDRFDKNLCNSAEKPNLGPEEVGRYRGGASPSGCVDMAGNVYEWTASWYSAYPGNTAIEKDYGQVFRVLRGGSFRSREMDVRCTSRHYARATEKRNDYGFRCARDAEPERGTQTASARP